MLVGVSRQALNGWMKRGFEWPIQCGDQIIWQDQWKKDSPAKAKKKIDAGLRKGWAKEQKDVKQNVCWSRILGFFRACCLLAKMLNSTKQCEQRVWQPFYSPKTQQPLINISRVTDLSKAGKKLASVPWNPLGSMWALSKTLRVSVRVTDRESARQ